MNALYRMPLVIEFGGYCAGTVGNGAVYVKMFKRKFTV